MQTNFDNIFNRLCYTESKDKYQHLPTAKDIRKCNYVWSTNEKKMIKDQNNNEIVEE